MTASLPMYDMESTQNANDRFWSLIRSALGYGPVTLTRAGDPHRLWESADLFFSQTCGLPYRTELIGRVQLIGTPDYGLPECPPGFYCSHIIVRANDPRERLADFSGSMLARNDRRSQSGWAALENLARADGLSFANNTLETGAHITSISKVASGAADLASIDALTWDLLSSGPDLCDDLRILMSTPPTPGLPYITSLTRNASDLAEAVSNAIEHLSEPDQNALRLKSLVSIPTKVYCAVPTP
ncbi:MAG: PhnD/SsuA/transferrin family substrate-binding protein [Pseudomonadota bacterium]